MRRILGAMMMLLMSCACAWGEISKDVVESAWKRIAKADGFKEVPINYEHQDAPNAWVKFQNKDNFSVHVTEGLMKILNTEDEIAGVLGHEIGHVRLGHYGQGVGRAVGWAIVGHLLGRIGGWGGTIAQGAGQIGANLAESGFSRGQEVEADDYGTELLKKAGYDPYGLYNAMKAFADNKYVTQPNGFNSHPPTERRLQHLQEKAGEVKSSPVSKPKPSRAATKNDSEGNR
ncbi:MAG: M48 family metallopeptidase [Synergistaceae bacterium]|nr:M48 family metallopeptidase [Synergistaceae bacterium]